MKLSPALHKFCTTNALAAWPEPTTNAAAPPNDDGDSDDDDDKWSL